MQHAFQVTENVQNYAAKAMQLNEHLLIINSDVFTGAELASPLPLDQLLLSCCSCRRVTASAGGSQQQIEHA